VRPSFHEALWLLSRYVQLLRAQQAAMSPVLRHTAVAHAHWHARRDLSYFNRSFRRRFGASPSDVRHAFRRGDA
jgi:AraC-like DNA-binding protein